MATSSIFQSMTRSVTRGTDNPGTPRPLFSRAGEPARSAAASVQAEVGEVEARRHDAADQYGRMASRRSALPYAAGDVGLWLLAGPEGAARSEERRVGEEGR